jgi:hypothetical protein
MSATKRTQEEILKRIDEVKENDAFGYQTTDLLEYLEFESAKKFLTPDVTKDEWKQQENTPREVMIDYMDFAWQKANDKRGLSASRSMEHYTSWLWLDGDEELYQTLANYEFYGKPQLVKICEYLGLDPNKYDDGVRENN